MKIPIEKLYRLTVFLLLLIVLLPVAGTPAESVTGSDDKFETRCGWFSNPTPANIWLYDRDGEWTIGVQGGYQVKDDWDWPVFTPKQWVTTNSGSHGYGCACLQVKVDRNTHTVQAIKSSRARPLAACRQDQSINKREKMFK